MDFIKEKDILLDKTDKEKISQLIQSILSTKEDLNKAHKNFDYAEEGLIDFYSYQIKALQTKFDYLTRVAKSKKIDFNSPYQNVI